MAASESEAAKAALQAQTAFLSRAENETLSKTCQSMLTQQLCKVKVPLHILEIIAMNREKEGKIQDLQKLIHINSEQNMISDLVHNRTASQERKKEALR